MIRSLIGGSIGLVVGVGIGWVLHARHQPSETVATEEVRSSLIAPDFAVDSAALSQVANALPVDSIILEHSIFAPWPNYRVVLVRDGPSVYETRIRRGERFPAPGRYLGHVDLRSYYSLAATAHRLRFMETASGDALVPPVDAHWATLTVVGWGQRVTHVVSEARLPEIWVLAEAVDGLVDETTWTAEDDWHVP